MTKGAASHSRFARKRVAFVVQRCGLEVNGGAELLCRLIAERLARRYETEIITTCALDYLTWANHYPAGEQRLNQVSVRRFPVKRPRNIASFSALSESIRARMGRLTLQDEEAWMREQGPWSPELFEYLRKAKHDYDAFIFFTYLYATTYFGLPLVADKALLVPTAHDEWPIYLGIWDRLIELPRAFVFNSEEELSFLRRRFPKAALNGPIVGVAVEPPPAPDPSAFRNAHGIEHRFALYLGRLDPSKGLDQLLSDFRAYRDSTGDSSTELVLVGKSAMEIPSRPGVRVLGFLSEQQKWEALAACEVLVMPSPHESLSIACLEAWSMGKPVLVTARSEVLVGQCRRSQAGLWYRNTDEFCAAMECLLEEPALRLGLGAKGRNFVQANYCWPRIVEAYGNLVG
jgi:glycosyltransferase involved in cell wall biosynthesis